MSPKLNKQFEIAKLNGLQVLLKTCHNGRTVHDIKNIEANIRNWIWLLETQDQFSDEDLEPLRRTIESAKRMIRRERDITNRLH